MQITTNRSTLELSRGSIFISRPSFELHFQVGSGWTFTAFDKRREGADLEFWALGCHLVFSRK